MHYPTFEEAQHLRDTAMGPGANTTQRPLLPLYRDILADVETPVSVYSKVSRHRRPYSYLLESVTGGEHIGRYSLIGNDPYMVMTHTGEKAILRTFSDDGTEASTTEEITCSDPLAFIEAEMSQYSLVNTAGFAPNELPNFHGGAVGYLAYEAVARFERLPVPEHDELGLPMAIFCFTKTLLVFDHLKHRVRLITHLHLDAPDFAAEYRRGVAVLDDIQQRLQQPMCLPEEPEPVHEKDASQVVSNFTRFEFEAIVQQAIDYIRAGDIFQVVPSQRLSRHVNAAPLTVYRALRAINPSPYMFYLDLHDFQIIGGSPELLVRVQQNEMTIHPIAGTRPRGTDRENDLQLEDELVRDPKERAEHVMLVDLARNDVGRVCLPGSVRVNAFMEVELYSHVMHLVSDVAGQLRKDVSPYDALRAGFPAGTVTGAPKIRAMEIISELEGTQRGVYAGAVGSFSFCGTIDTAIALRTMVMRDSRAYVQAGCGVVADSQPGYEYQETLNKAQALLRALDEAESIATEQRKRKRGDAFSTIGG